MSWPGTGEPTTAKELNVYIDQECLLQTEDFQIYVRIMDVRSSFGNVQFLVTPLDGHGEKWVGATRCQGYTPELRSL